MSVEDRLEGIGAFLKGRFEVIRLLGEGGQARTFLGVDLHSGAAVAVKELRLGRVDDWKALELFEREGSALRALNHERIPAYIDAFHVEEEGERRFFLVQEYVEGRNLKEWME